MTFIETVPEDDATGATAEIYAADREASGFLPNFTEAFSLRPEVYRAWKQLSGTIRGGMDLRRYELATLAAATRLRSSYCTLAHGSVLMDKQFLSPDELTAAVSDYRSAGLDEAEVAVMDLAAKVVEDATAVEQADIDRLRDARPVRPGHPRRRTCRRGAVLLQQGPRLARRRARREVRGARPRVARRALAAGLASASRSIPWSTAWLTRGSVTRLRSNSAGV